jgi:hypothetical protein
MHTKDTIRQDGVFVYLPYRQEISAMPRTTQKLALHSGWKPSILFPIIEKEG